MLRDVGPGLVSYRRAARLGGPGRTSLVRLCMYTRHLTNYKPGYSRDLHGSRPLLGQEVGWEVPCGAPAAACAILEQRFAGDPGQEALEIGGAFFDQGGPDFARAAITLSVFIRKINGGCMIEFSFINFLTKAAQNSLERLLHTSSCSTSGALISFPCFSFAGQEKLRCS